MLNEAQITYPYVIPTSETQDVPMYEVPFNDPRSFTGMLDQIERAVASYTGNQDAHIHFDGHLSGCYYVRIPDEVSASDNGEDGTVAGGFEVGRPPPEFGCRRKHRHRVIKPQEGMIVLFPSYMYHQTIPFQSEQRRICVAFDVMPR